MRSSWCPTPRTPPRFAPARRRGAGRGLGHRRHTIAVLAVQGPRSARCSTRRAAGRAGLHGLHRRRRDGDRVTVCRTGYTGEHGYELLVPAERRGRLWDALLGRRGLGIRPCGLGARDTLRTEMGYPLHGQDLSPGHLAGPGPSGWAVGWRKPAFWGRERSSPRRRPARRRQLWGLTDRAGGSPGRTWRAGRRRRRSARSPAGRSPRPAHGIALALLDTARASGGRRGRRRRARPAAAVVVQPPFVPSHAR